MEPQFPAYAFQQIKDCKAGCRIQHGRGFAEQDMPGRPHFQWGVQHVPQAEKTQFRQSVADPLDGKVDFHAGRAGKSRQLHALAEAQGFKAGIAAAGGGAGFGFDEGIAEAGNQFPRQRIPFEQPEKRAQRNVPVEFEPHPEKPREWGFGRKRPVSMQPDGVHEPALLVAGAASGRPLVLGLVAFDAVLVVGTHERRAPAGHAGLVAFGTGLIFRAQFWVDDAVLAAVVADDTVFDFGALVMVVVIEGDGGAAVEIAPFPAGAGGSRILNASAVCVTVGRAPNTAGLAEAGIALDQRGWIIVDDTLETSVPGVYAIGDVTGPRRIMLAHMAAAEAHTAVHNILHPEKRKTQSYAAVPSAIFTSPEIGDVGLTEEQAKEQGMAVRSAVFQFRELGKAQAMGALSGLFKIVAEEGTGRLLGVHIAGAHASDLIAEATLALQKGCTARELFETIHAHPTLSEGLYEAAGMLA